MLPQILATFLLFFFLSGFSFKNIHNSNEQQGKVKAISLTHLYHFHPLHRYIDISQAITAQSQQSDATEEPLVSQCKQLITMLCAFIISYMVAPFLCMIVLTIYGRNFLTKKVILFSHHWSQSFPQAVKGRGTVSPEGKNKIKWGHFWQKRWYRRT